MQLAVSLAQADIEQMRSLGFGNVNYTNFPASATQKTDATLAVLQSCNRTVVITTNYNGDARLMEVAVTIAWSGRTQKTLQVTLYTVLTNRTADVCI